MMLRPSFYHLSGWFILIGLPQYAALMVDFWLSRFYGFGSLYNFRETEMGHTRHFAASCLSGMMVIWSGKEEMSLSSFGF